MLRGRRERGSSSALPSTSLLIPPNPAIANPGSDTTARGGILLNPLSKDGTSKNSSLSPQGRSASSTSNRSASLSSQNSRITAAARRSTSLSSHTSSGISSSSEGDEDASSSSTGTAASVSSNSTGRLKFAPLPESGRIRRSNSITLGVAARAQMLQGQGMGGGGGGGGRSAPQAPHWQQQVYNSNANNSAPMWYNGGPMPDNVKTFKDLKPGIKKAWGAITRRRSSSNASSASTSSTTSNAAATTGGGGGGGSSSEGDISSINEEDEDQDIETPPSTAGDSTSSLLSPPSSNMKGKGAESATLTKEGLVVKQPPGSELSSNATTTPYEGGQPLRRKDSDAYSDISSNALSDSEETDIDSREAAALSAQGLSESPSYTPGVGPSGHYYRNHHSHHTHHQTHGHHHGHSHGHGHHDENFEGVRSGEVTPKRGHSPPSSPGVSEKAHPQHWTPQISDYQYTNVTGNNGHGNGNSGSGSGSTPGSGSNTPRRRMSMGDMSTSFNHNEGHGHYSNRKGMSVFGFDEAQLKNRLGQMDLNSRRRKENASPQQEQEEGDGRHERINDGRDEDEVPLPVDSRQVKGAEMEVAV